MIAFPEAAVPATTAGIITAAAILLWLFFAQLGILPVPSPPLFRPHTGTHQAAIRVSVRAADHGTITRTPTADRPPWVTAGQPALTDEATLAMYRGGYGSTPDLETVRQALEGLRDLPGRGDYGVTPVARVLEGERLAKGLIA